MQGILTLDEESVNHVAFLTDFILLYTAKDNPGHQLHVCFQQKYQDFHLLDLPLL